ncbi:unnamed protein product [Musa hybrid cultivar]
MIQASVTQTQRRERERDTATHPESILTDRSESPSSDMHVSQCHPSGSLCSNATGLFPGTRQRILESSFTRLVSAHYKSTSRPSAPFTVPMATKALIPFLFVAAVLGSTASACGTCTHPTFPRPPSSKRPPKHLPPYTNPPVVGPPAEGGGAPPGTSPPATCSLDILKLGLCLDVLGGLVHVGLGKPAENVCCPVLQGLLELEAATCLCTAIKLRLLDLDIYIPLALQVLITCGKDPAPGYLCPLS